MSTRSKQKRDQTSKLLGAETVEGLKQKGVKDTFALQLARMPMLDRERATRALLAGDTAKGRKRVEAFVKKEADDRNAVGNEVRSLLHERTDDEVMGGYASWLNDKDQAVASEPLKKALALKQLVEEADAEIKNIDQAIYDEEEKEVNDFAISTSIDARQDRGPDDGLLSIVTMMQREADALIAYGKDLQRQGAIHILDGAEKHAAAIEFLESESKPRTARPHEMLPTYEAAQASADKIVKLEVSRADAVRQRDAYAHKLAQAVAGLDDDEADAANVSRETDIDIRTAMRSDQAFADDRFIGVIDDMGRDDADDDDES